MQLSLQTFTTLVQNMAASVQSAAAQLLDLSVGSTLRAVLEANASVALWLQWLILLVLQTTRAATSAGSDLDTWMADYALVRLPASAANGLVSFSRFTPSSAALIPLGALVRTADGTQTYTVVQNTSNAAWSATQQGYVVPAGTASVTVPVTALTAGSAGNVQASAVSLLATAIPGIDQATNAAPFQGGLDAESDPAFRGRFVNFINSRSRATTSAIGYAIQSIQQGLDYTIQQNADTTGRTVLGSFVVTVDDGTGYPSASLLSGVFSAVDAVRPIGSVFAVRPPVVLPANISVVLTLASGAQASQIDGPVNAAIFAWVNQLTIGMALPLSRIAQVVYGVEPSIINVSQITINGNAADLLPPSDGLIRCGTVAVN